MQKLIEALHVIKEECKKNEDCENCLLSIDSVCGLQCSSPDNWEVNDKAYKALL